jgi:hypothetical protein
MQPSTIAYLHEVPYYMLYHGKMFEMRTWKQWSAIFSHNLSKKQALITTNKSLTMTLA